MPDNLNLSLIRTAPWLLLLLPACSVNNSLSGYKSDADTGYWEADADADADADNDTTP